MGGRRYAAPIVQSSLPIRPIQSLEIKLAHTLPPSPSHFILIQTKIIMDLWSAFLRCTQVIIYNVADNKCNLFLSSPNTLYLPHLQVYLLLPGYRIPLFRWTGFNTKRCLLHCPTSDSMRLLLFLHCLSS